MPDADGYFCNAVECSDWGTAFLQKLFGIHDIQDGAGRARRLVDGDRINDSAICDLVGSGETASTLARGFTSRCKRLGNEFPEQADERLSQLKSIPKARAFATD